MTETGHLMIGGPLNGQRTNLTDPSFTVPIVAGYLDGVAMFVGCEYIRRRWVRSDHKVATCYLSTELSDREADSLYGHDLNREAKEPA